MTIRFLKTSTPNTQISIADSAGLTLPDSDWSIGFTIVFDGDTAGTGYQLILRTGNSGEVGGMVVIFDPFGSSTTATKGRIYVQVNGSTSNSRCITPQIEAGKAYYYVLQRSSGSLFSKLCPVLTTAPTDGSAVQSSTGFSVAGAALDGAQGLILGVHSVTNRKLDQSLARVFLASKALSDYEIAQLAYGKEVTAFASPLVYLRMNDVSDVADTGTMANVVTTTGPLATGTAPGFGFSSTSTAPVISGKPVIGGSPTPGVSTGYTAAPATGNPAPTITQQWIINGTDVSGATGATYTPAGGDEGKQLQVRQTATNGVGTPATATSDPVLVTSATVGLDVAEITAERIFQRISGSAIVPLSGTYVGTAPTSIEYQLYLPAESTAVSAWTNANATINGDGAWTASPSMPAPTNGLKYRIAVRSKNSSGTTLFTTPIKTNRFGIGDIIIAGGSSSPATWFTDGSGTGNIVDANSTSTNVGGTWQLFGTDGRAGQMAEYIAQRIGVPVAMCTVALGGSLLTDWASATGSRWTAFRSALAAVGGKLGGLFFSAGSNDVTNSNNSLTVAAHLALMNSVRDNARADTGQPNLPILWSGINRRLDALALQANNARTAENQFGDQPNCYHVQSLDFELEAAGVHLTGAGYAACCVRMRYVWAEAILGTYRRGPKIVSFTHSDTRVLVTLQHRNGTDFTPANGHSGFVITDDVGSATITSSARVDSTKIVLYADRSLVNPKVTYLAGPAPDTTASVLDNGTMALPMTVEAFMSSAAGTLPTTDIQAPVLSGVITVSGVSQTGFTMAWDAATDNIGVDHYETSIDGGATWTSSGTATTRTVSTASAGTLYNLRVRAHDAAGNQSAVLSGTVTTTSAADTTAPVLTGQLTVSNVTSSSAALTWPAATDNVGVVGYERSLDGGTNYVPVGNQTTVGLTGLAASTTFQARIRAYDGAGNRSAALSASFTTAATSGGGTVNFTPSIARTVTVGVAPKTFSAVGEFWSFTGTKTPKGPKDPDSTIDITFDWAPWLADMNNPGIANVSFLLTGTGVQNAGSSTTGTKATVFLSGGSVGVEASITCRVTTSSTPARIEDRTVYLAIGDQ